MINNSQKGFAMPIIITIVALVVVIGGLAYFATREQSPVSDEVMMEKNVDVMMEKKEGEMMKKDEDAMMDKSETMIKYSGAMLAGTSAPLLDFTKADYDAALNSDKLIVLYFYANWCPICKAEFPLMQKAFDELDTDKVIGFRVNYNDNQTDNDEKNLAKQFGVAYQHTKVFVKNGQRILKSPEGWDRARYGIEINKFLTE